MRRALLREPGFDPGWKDGHSVVEVVTADHGIGCTWRWSDPADGVPLFTRCIEIRKENRVDDRRVLVDFQACRAPSKDKELVVIEGWTHYDLYDQPEPVQQALDHLIPFRKKFL
ncbi:hypothetical protein ACLQ3K_15255 [Tsukamurella sp. DT100]|uniref:hypothetical protein n=1 Tax=Tsukamurella sp. DT100 TaxID=3393415 RepID=UPI003CF18678